MVEIVIETVPLKFRRSHELLMKVAKRLNQEVARPPRLDVYHTNLKHRVSRFHDAHRALRARAEEVTNA